MSSEESHFYLEDRTAGAYLTQARDSLFKCGDARQLYGSCRESADVPVRDRLLRHLRAQDTQLELARNSILFSALAGEAYINGFLAEKLTAAPDYDAMEKLRTLDKYILGPELVTGRRLFDRGAEPGQSLGALFRLRHDLVHPKMKPVKVDRGTLIDERFAHFNTEAAARFLVCVADAARTLSAHTSRGEDTIAGTILSERQRFLDLGLALRKGLPAPVKAPDSASAPGLFAEFAKSLPEPHEPVEPKQPEQREPRQDPPPAVRARLKRDRLRPPATVPQEPLIMLDYLSTLPGTATSTLPYAPTD